MNTPCPTSDSLVSANAWYAICTRAKHEKVVSDSLKVRGFEEYLPIYDVRRKWSDRTKDITVPLFPGYVFCRFDAKSSAWVLSTPGVVSIVKFGGTPAAVKDGEIQAIKKALSSN